MADVKGLETKTFYEVLGVPEDASSEQIREVYREVARIYHPDSNFYDEIVPQKASGEQVQIFKIITAAYNTLIDPNKRAEYDRSVAPLLSLKRKVKDWDAEAEEFTPTRPLEPEPGTTPPHSRPRRMTATFGRREFFDSPDPLVEAPTPKPLSRGTPRGPLAWLAIGMGIVCGAAVGAVTYAFLAS